MRILLIGASGTIGSEVARALRVDHEVVTAGRTTGEVPVDLSSPDSILVINDNGSFTLTSGVLAREPMPGSSAISMVNAGVEGFVRAVQLEMERGLRVNVVSPVWVAETLKALGRDSSTGMPAAQVARAYVAAVTGTQRGAVLDVREYV